jgi:hypothetical protein
MTNLLQNPGFEDPAAAPTILTGSGQGGLSAAPHWTTWNNSPATTTTDVLPGTRPRGGKQMLHVCTTGEGNGIVQTFQPPHPSVRSSVWVFVVRGQVGMGTGHGGNTHVDAKSTHTGAWEQLHAPNGVSPATELIVYASSSGGACYYVEAAAVMAP